MLNVLDVQESLTLRALYENRGDTRVIGGLLLGLGLIGWVTAIGGLAASIGESLSASFGGRPTTNGPLAFILVGATLGTICVPVGLALALLKDVAEVRIDPDGAIRF